MSFGGSLQIGRSGLLTAQTALDTVGHNLSNAATRGYHRQQASLNPANSQDNGQGVSVGRGVQIEAITRQVNDALLGRLRSAIAEESGSSRRQELLRQLEAIEHEFTDADLTTRLGRFFDGWSELANNPQDKSLRALVTREGEQLASFVRDLHARIGDLNKQTLDETASATRQVNELLGRVEELNDKIGVQEGSGTSAAGLRDRRDNALAELAEYLDISTVAQDNGKVDIYVGSEPIMLNGKSRGVELKRDEDDSGKLLEKLVTADDQSTLDAAAGNLGAMMRFRQDDLPEAVGALDALAHELVWAVNRQHSQGQGLSLHDSITSGYRVEDADAALNAPESGLDFTPGHGSFRLHVTQDSTGERKSSTINLDLDGIDPDNDTSLNDLAATIDAVENVSASVTAAGRLEITTAADHRVSFSDDTSGVLAALGVNTFFEGGGASDIAVDQRIAAAPELLAVSQDHTVGGNANAHAIAAVRDKPAEAIGGLTIREHWNRHVEDYGARLAEAGDRLEADASVRENLESQHQSVSGVNVDEEAVDLMRYQRAYQASARFLSVVDEMMQTLLQSV